MRALGPNDRLAIAYDGIAELGEEERSFGRGPATLGDMIRVVEAHAHDLAREFDRRERLKVADRDGTARPLRRGRSGRERSSFLDERAEAVLGEGKVEPAVHAAQPDDGVVTRQQPDGRTVGSKEGEEPHRSRPAQVAAGDGLADASTDGAGVSDGAGVPVGAGVSVGLGQRGSGLVRSPC